MSKKESFPNRLKAALVKKEEEERLAAQPVEEETKDTAAIIEEQKRINEEAKQKNRVVSKLDSQLPIVEYMEDLRVELGLKEAVKKWDPDHGKIAYSLVYHTGERKLWVSAQVKDIPKADAPQGSDTSSVTILNHELRQTQEVLGLVLDHKGLAEIYSQTCAKKSDYHPESTNPLAWLAHKHVEQPTPVRRKEGTFDYLLNPSSRKFLGLPDPGFTPPPPQPPLRDSMNDVEGAFFDLTSEEGLENLAQHLISFYLRLNDDSFSPDNPSYPTPKGAFDDWKEHKE